MKDNNYCVYLHKNKQTGEVYYIGSGVQNKREFHFTNRSKAWHRIHEEFGTDIEIYATKLTMEEARETEQNLIDSNKYPNIVNSNRVYLPPVYDISELKKLVEYDERFVTCLTFKVKTGPRALVGGQAGSLIFDDSGKPRRCTVKLFGRMTACSRVVWMLHNGEIPSGFIIDHIDGDCHNNKIINLRCISLKDNARNRASSKKKKNSLPCGFSINKTGSIVSQVSDGAEKEVCSFSTKLYGYDKALELAKAWRIQTLNRLGILSDYSERHLGFNPNPYLECSIDRSELFSPAGENIWVKRSKGEVVGLSSGTTRKNRIYLTVGKYRSYEQALELCKEHLRLLKENAS